MINAINDKPLDINDDIEYTHNQQYLVARQTDNFKTIAFHKRYIGGLVIIKSNMNTGKTEWVQYMLDNFFKDKIVIFISN